MNKKARNIKIKESPLELKSKLDGLVSQLRNLPSNEQKALRKQIVGYSRKYRDLTGNHYVYPYQQIEY